MISNLLLRYQLTQLVPRPQFRYAAKPKLQGSFAWHAWTQAMVLGEWIDLDATLWNVP